MKDDVLSMQIEQARNGDEQAIAGLIARQMPQIRSLAAKAVRPGLDFDDAVQEGIIGLFSALETFDAQKGAAFATYANVCVQNAIVSAVRAAGRSKHAPLNTSVPYTEHPRPRRACDAERALYTDNAEHRHTAFGT